MSGDALKKGKTHADNTFHVDTRNAGYGGLSLSVEGPSKAEIKCKDHEDGRLDVSYRPTEPGLYIVNLKFADQHVPGSPFAVAVSGQECHSICLLGALAVFHCCPFIEIIMLTQLQF